MDYDAVLEVSLRDAQRASELDQRVKMLEAAVRDLIMCAQPDDTVPTAVLERLHKVYMSLK